MNYRLNIEYWIFEYNILTFKLYSYDPDARVHSSYKELQHKLSNCIFPTTHKHLYKMYSLEHWFILSCFMMLHTLCILLYARNYITDLRKKQDERKQM